VQQELGQQGELLEVIPFLVQLQARVEEEVEIILALEI